MSYCVHCGVELSDYHKKCPLCGTKVLDTNNVTSISNTDYPEYVLYTKHSKSRANRLFIATILSLLFFLYALIPFLIDFFINKSISWSLIVFISVSLLWVGVALPFFIEKPTFFRLFTYDSLASLIYLLILNYIISGNITWAKFTSLGLIIIWVILSGIFIPDRIRTILPLKFYYILSSIILSVIFVLFINCNMSLIFILIPLNTIIFVLTLLSYFIVTAKIYDFLGLLIVILSDISIFAVFLNLILSKQLQGNFSLSWSIIVLIITIPLLTTAFAVRKSKQLRKFISKKTHR